MNDQQISAVSEKNDLEMTISSNLRSSQHCSEVAETADKVVGFIGQIINAK